MTNIPTDSEDDKPFAEMTRAELEDTKTELIRDRADNVARLADIKKVLEELVTASPNLADSRAARSLNAERHDLTADNAQIDGELREVSQRIRVMADAAFADKFRSDRVIALVCARIAAGDARSVVVITEEAIKDLHEIQLVLA